MKLIFILALILIWASGWFMALAGRAEQRRREIDDAKFWEEMGY